MYFPRAKSPYIITGGIRMRFARFARLLPAVTLGFLAACSDAETPKVDPCADLKVTGTCVGVDLSAADAADQIAAAFVNATNNSTIALSAGHLELSSELSFTGLENIHVRGAGMDQTVLSFAGQSQGAGIHAENVIGITVEDLALEDTAGDSLFIVESEDIVVRGVRVEWTDGADAGNGKYGIYPVRSTNILVEHTVSRGASDAGIYIGESNNVIARYNNAYENVSGLQIENCFDSWVYENTVTNNTLGLFIFDLPGKLQNKNGGRHLVHDNVVKNNNVKNFADKEAIAGSIPSGTGLLVMATANVEVHSNTIEGNNTIGTGVVSFFLAGKPNEDSAYFPYPMTVYIHDNLIVDNGTNPGQAGVNDAAIALNTAFGTDVPEVLFDGLVTTVVDGTPDAALNPHYICAQANKRAGDEPARFASLELTLSTNNDIDIDYFLSDAGQAAVLLDPAAFDCAGPAQAEVDLGTLGAP